MTKQVINVGTTANDKKGDSLRAAFQKVNANFTELYTALGLDNGAGLNLGNFQFTDNTIKLIDPATDGSTLSTVIVDQPVEVSSDLTVGGDILPKVNLGGNLGSPTQQWKSLYVSTNTIYINNVPLSVDESNNLLVNGSSVVQSVLPSQTGNNGKYLTTDGAGNVSWASVAGGISASSSDTFTNKTMNIAVGQGNTFQIQGNSITSYSGSGSIIALTTLPTLYGLNLNNSSLTMDGGTGSYFWKPTAFDGTGTIHKAGVYKSNPDANNALFTFGANSTGNMSVAVEGSLFVGTGVPSNSGGLNTNYAGWLVVQAGAKFGGDLNTTGGLHFDDDAGGYIQFQNGKVFKVVPVPTHSYGATGDVAGLVAFDASYLYYCKQTYVDNSTNIWVRVAWSGTTW